MEAKDYWQLFLETGAPEMYMLYSKMAKTEAANVSDNPSPGVTGYGVQ